MVVSSGVAKYTYVHNINLYILDVDQKFVLYANLNNIHLLSINLSNMYSG